MNLQSVSRLAAFLIPLLLLHPVLADTAATGTPSRGDALAKGDRIILNTDVPIFQLDPNADDKGKTTKACAPWRSQIEIESVPKTTTTGATTATARIVRVGPSKLRRKIDSWLGIEGAPYEVSAGNGVKVAGCRQVAADTKPTVLQGTTYSFTPNDLDGYSTDRFGLTYGVVIVPNKVIIADRSFISSSSVLPYVGYEAWGPGVAGAIVFAAGIGTAPSSSQAPTTTGQSSGTRATFSVATGIVGSIAGVFKVGLLIGVDTQGKDSGFKYQGKPWIGISLGAGTQ